MSEVGKCPACGAGEAISRRHFDGTVTAIQADSRIHVYRGLAELADYPFRDGPDDPYLQLDTAGLHRYIYRGVCPADHDTLIYERVSPCVMSEVDAR